MCVYANELAASGAPLRDDEMVTYLLAGLDEDYNHVFIVVVTWVDLITSSELYSQLLNFEHHTNLQTTASSGESSSTMTASRGSGYSSGRGTGPFDHRSHRGHGRGCGRTSHDGSSNRGGGSSSNNSACPQFQICSKVGHMTKTCWYCYNDDAPDHRTTTMASSGADPNWYTDLGATDNIIGDWDNLTMHDTYLGQDQIHAANRLGMNIKHIGNSIILTSGRNLILNNVLHASSTYKNIISIHWFTLDNGTFVEFHHYFFLIKDQKMRNVLLH
jgi:hypothetical protein